MEKIKYSFLVANYNKEKAIKKCLNQLLKQTIDNYEIIIVDDASTDKSLEIINRIKQKSDKIKFCINEVNMGIGYTRNKLLKLSSGEYIIFVDSDDYVSSDMLKYIDERNDGYDLIRFQNIVEPATATQKIIESNDDKYRFCCKERGLIDPNDVIIEWCTNPYCANALLWSYCIKKTLFTNNNIIFPKLSFHEDFAVVPLLISYATKLLVINDILYHYLQYDNSTTKLKNMKRNYEEKLNFYSNKYYQYKIATMNIINKLDASLLRDDIKKELKLRLLMRLDKRYIKYTNILMEEHGGKYEEGCLFEK